MRGSAPYFGILYDKNSSFEEMPGKTVSSGVPSVLNIKCSSSSTVEPGNNGRPHAIS